MPQWLASSLSEARKPDRAGAPASGRRRRHESPILRGERDISRKAIAQGMSDRLRSPVCSCPIFFLTLPTAPRVTRTSGIPFSFIISRENERQSSADPRRENADVYLLFDIRIGDEGD